MRSAWKGILVGLVLLAVLGAIATRAGWIVASPPRPQGTGAWFVARAIGLLAYVALSVEVIVGLLVSTRSAGRLVARGQLVELHGWLSPLSLALVVAHGGILLADRYAQFDVLDVIVPFASERWRGAVGVGGLAAYAMLAVHASFALRRRIGTAWWRRLHFLSFLAFVLATVHALAAGTDRANPWFAAVYAVVLGVVVVLLGIRIVRARRAPTPDRA